MKKLWLLIEFSLLIGTWVVLWHLIDPPHFSYQSHVRSLVVVSQLENDGGPHGTGIIIGRRSVITKLHITQSNDRVYIRTYDGERMGATVINRDLRHDLALLHTDKVLSHPALLGYDLPTVGQKVYLIGNVEDLMWSYHEGYVMYAGLRNVPVDFQSKKQDLIQVSMTVGHGDSGGALFDEDGYVIGVADCMQGESGTTLGFFSPSDQLCDKLLYCREEP